MTPRSSRSSRSSRGAAKRDDIGASPARNTPAPQSAPVGWGMRCRELVDEIVFVFAIVMFMKMFLVEIYKIPTGSMTPTLLGGTIADTDLNGDGLLDLVYWEPEGGGRFMDRHLLFINDGRLKLRDPNARLSPLDNRRLIEAASRMHKIDAASNVYDKILVNKLVYWFKAPRRGEVVVFKVPDPPFRRETPIYIKRLVGEPGETLSFVDDPQTGGGLAQLALDGKPVTEPDFFAAWRYNPTVRTGDPNFVELPYAEYGEASFGRRRLENIKVPDAMVFMMGDNTDSSLDSRYWGGVPIENLKGRAFYRVWPPYRIGRIH